MREPMWRTSSGVYYPSKEAAQKAMRVTGHTEHQPQYCELGLGGLICVLVDDVLGGGKGTVFQAAMQRLQAEIKFGKWQSFADERDYGGKSIHQLPNGAISISMVKYVQKLQELEVTREEKKHPEALASEKQKKAYRTLIGGLLWAARTG
eukprot:1924921-Amphidinium_carterae.1